MYHVSDRLLTLLLIFLCQLEFSETTPSNQLQAALASIQLLRDLILVP